MAAEFQKAFGLRTGPALALALDNLDKARQAMSGVAASAGTVDHSFDVFSEKGSMVFQRLGAALTTIKISLGEALLPAVDIVAKGLPKIATWLQRMTVLRTL